MSVRINKLAAAVVVTFAASGANAAIQTLDGVGFDISYDDAALGLFGTPAWSAAASSSRPRVRRASPPRPRRVSTSPTPPSHSRSPPILATCSPRSPWSKGI